MAVVWRPQQARGAQSWRLVPQVWPEAWLVWRWQARVAVLLVWEVLQVALFLLLLGERLAQPPVSFPLWPELLEQAWHPAWEPQQEPVAEWRSLWGQPQASPPGREC